MEKENWISVSEKLPEKVGKYLISCYSGVEIAVYSFGKFARPWNLKNFYKVTHWQPLPEPPQL